MPENTPETSTPFTRRRLLGGGAAVAAATAALSLPANVRKALAEPLPSKQPRLSDIKHVVLLMQENRSFDHYFGTFPGVRGFGDRDALIQKSGPLAGKSVFYQQDNNPAQTSGYLLPWHLDTLTTGAQAIPSTSHAWLVQHSALNNGLNNNWMPAHNAADGLKNGQYVMGYYEEQDIPFQRALASAFTILDNGFCSVLGPTHPNRYMWMTGTVDPTAANGGPALDNNVTNGTYTWKTYAESLDEAGVSWKCYQGADNYGTNVLENFKQFQNAPTTSSLYQNAMTTQPYGQFEIDAMNDNLPAVSWLFPTSTQSEHPNYLPNAGAAYVASKIDAIAANPEVWAKTVFILTYDENDGLFDHVPPIIPPAGTQDEYVTVAKSPGGTTSDGLWVGPGFRVPTIIVSPWTAGGWVFSEQSDHTSSLQFLEKVTGVPAPNITNWRRENFGDLTKAFRFNSYAEAPKLYDTSGPLQVAQYTATEYALPTAPDTNQVPPVQKSGFRPHVG
ncbi:MAG TPA: alkaline phosphatase family protein [Trebonia sp.]